MNEKNHRPHHHRHRRHHHQSRRLAQVLTCFDPLEKDPCGRPDHGCCTRVPSGYGSSHARRFQIFVKTLAGTMMSDVEASDTTANVKSRIWPEGSLAVWGVSA